MPELNYCPCCGRHCDLSEPHCDRGREYLRTGMNKEDKLILNLRDIGHMIRFLFEGKGSQKRVLIILLEKGKMTQRELTERLGIQPGSASEVIGKLENADLICRTTSPEDRRTADIVLTENGRRKAQEALENRKRRHQEMFSCLTEEEKDTLLTLTEKLNRDWDNRYREGEKALPHEGHHGRRNSSRCFME